MGEPARVRSAQPTPAWEKWLGRRVSHPRPEFALVALNRRSASCQPLLVSITRERGGVTLVSVRVSTVRPAVAEVMTRHGRCGRTVRALPGGGAVCVEHDRAHARRMLPGDEPFGRQIATWSNLLGQSHNEGEQFCCRWRRAGARFGIVWGSDGKRCTAPPRCTGRRCRRGSTGRVRAGVLSGAAGTAEGPR